MLHASVMPFLNELQLMSSFRFEVLCHNNFKSSSEVGKVAMKTCFQLMCCQNWPAFFYNELLLPPDGLSNNNGRMRLRVLRPGQGGGVEKDQAFTENIKTYQSL